MASALITSALNKLSNKPTPGMKYFHPQTGLATSETVGYVYWGAQDPNASSSLRDKAAFSTKVLTALTPPCLSYLPKHTTHFFVCCLFFKIFKQVILYNPGWFWTRDHSEAASQEQGLQKCSMFWNSKLRTDLSIQLKLEISNRGKHTLLTAAPNICGGTGRVGVLAVVLGRAWSAGCGGNEGWGKSNGCGSGDVFGVLRGNGHRKMPEFSLES